MEKIGENAFYILDGRGHDTRTLVLPNTAIEIGKEAFYGRNFNTITIQSGSVENIGDYINGTAKVVRINTPKNEFKYDEGLIKILDWDNHNYNYHGKLVLAAPELCTAKSDIPGYIKLTEKYDDATIYSFDESRDKIIEVNTRYIMYYEPIEIERFDPCVGTVLYMAAYGGDERLTRVVVYEPVEMVAAKIKEALESLSKEIGGVAGLMQQVDKLCNFPECK